MPPQPLPGINFGTERYPEKVARRLRALNVATWLIAAMATFFAIVLGVAFGAFSVAIANAAAALAFALIPLLHRFGSLAGPLAFAAIANTAIFVICSMTGTDTGMAIQHLGVLAIVIVAVGVERTVLLTALSSVTAILIVALQVSAPADTGLLPRTAIIASIVSGVTLTCAILATVVFYALREAAHYESTSEIERERSEALLLNILPADIAQRLKGHKEATIADRYDSASVLFADMAGFTARAAHLQPDELVRFLDRVFVQLDALVEHHGLEKIKTSGDAYMVVSGAPRTRIDHAEALADLALAIRDGQDGLIDPEGGTVTFRIGLASGPVVAGVVGSRKFFYDVWGDTVNVASRMESTGEPGKIQVSASAVALLQHDFLLEKRGMIEVKGKGVMETHFLIGRKSSSSSDGAPLQQNVINVTR